MQRRIIENRLQVPRSKVTVTGITVEEADMLAGRSVRVRGGDVEVIA